MRTVNKKTMSTLNEEDKEFIRTHFATGINAEIGEHIGCSAVTVSLFARKEGLAKDREYISARKSVTSRLTRRL